MVFMKNLNSWCEIFLQIIYNCLLLHIYKLIETFRKIVILLQSLNDNRGKHKNSGMT